jgi:hypothetical protein
MRATTLRWTCAAVISASAAGFASRESDASPARAHGALVLTSFVQRDRIDVLRNATLELRFSSPIKKGSVDDSTLQVNAVTVAGPVPAVGARMVKGNVVRFDPARTQANFDASRAPRSAVTLQDHPFGFAATQDYEVRIPAGVRSLRGRAGRRIERTVAVRFRTTTAYDDPVPGQPSFVGDHGTGLLGFIPPRDGATGTVDPNAEVVFEFSEPMLLESLDPASTILVTNPGTGERVSGSIRADPADATGRRFLFAPSAGAVWDVQITLLNGITDLAGNPLKRAVGPAVFGTQ